MNKYQQGSEYKQGERIYFSAHINHWDTSRCYHATEKDAHDCCRERNDRLLENTPHNPNPAPIARRKNPPYDYTGFAFENNGCTVKSRSSPAIAIAQCPSPEWAAYIARLLDAADAPKPDL